jgi:hypothetical protein
MMGDSQRSTRQAAAAVSLVAGLVIAVVLLALVIRRLQGRESVTTGCLTVSGGAYSTPTPGPTPTVPSWYPMGWSGPVLGDWGGGGSPGTPAEMAGEAPVIAEVEVLCIEPARFWTWGGARPTSPDDDLGRDIFSPVILKAVKYWKGDGGAPGFVVDQRGGALDGVSYDVEPSPGFRVGDRGVAFLWPVPRLDLPEWSKDPHGRQLIDVAAAYGPKWEIASLVDYYAYREGQALSYFHATQAYNGPWVPLAMSVRDFEDQLRGALQP